jgi:hypothetical protein
MATLAEAIKDRKNFSDDTKFTAQNGFETTLGELRAFQDATGQDVAKAIEAEKAKIAQEQKEIERVQAESIEMWTRLKAAEEQLNNKTAAAAAASTTADWTQDPFFAPVAKYIKEHIEANVTKQAEQISQFQKALGLGVKYITDTFSEMRYSAMPEEFRKEVGYDAAVKTAAEKKYLDSGGVPDVRKVYDEWRTPRERKAETEKIQKEAYDKARSDLMSSQLSRPSGMPSTVAAPDANAPKTIRESFNRLKEDPEFLNQIYNLTGQGGQA